LISPIFLVEIGNYEGGLTLKNSNISRALFIIILLILLLNAIISTANLIEDGVVLRSVIPAISWVIAATLWIVAYFRNNSRES
jgi:hypothetical protein